MLLLLLLQVSVAARLSRQMKPAHETMVRLLFGRCPAKRGCEDSFLPCFVHVQDDLQHVHTEAAARLLRAAVQSLPGCVQHLHQ